MHDIVHAFTDNKHERLPHLRYSQHFLHPHTGSAGETEPSYELMLHTPLQHYVHPSHAPGIEQHIILWYFLNVRAFVFTLSGIELKNDRQVVLIFGSWYCEMVGLSDDISDQVSILMVRPSEKMANQHITSQHGATAQKWGHKYSIITLS